MLNHDAQFMFDDISELPWFFFISLESNFRTQWWIGIQSSYMRPESMTKCQVIDIGCVYPLLKVQWESISLKPFFCICEELLEAMSLATALRMIERPSIITNSKGYLHSAIFISVLWNAERVGCFIFEWRYFFNCKTFVRI